MALRLSKLSGVIFVGFAVAIESLAATASTAFYVAALDMKLTLDRGAVMAWLSICTPVVGLLAVLHTRNLFATNDACSDFLRISDSLRPALDHRDASVDDLGFR